MAVVDVGGLEETEACWVLEDEDTVVVVERAPGVEELD